MGVSAVPEARPTVVQTTDQFHHVRVRPTDAFEEFRTPLAGDTTLTTDRAGYDVREGRAGPDQWVVESVLVPIDVVDDGDAAKDRVRDVVTDLES